MGSLVYEAYAEEEKLPYAAGVCVNEAGKMIKAGRISEAIELLESFSSKAKDVSGEKAIQKGYSHYYIDYMLGNALMMLEENSSSKSGSGHGENKTLKKSSGQAYKKNSKDDFTPFLKKASQYYNNAVKKRADLAPAWLNLARCQYTLGDMENAGKAFIKGYEASAKADRKAMHLYYGAICFFQCGDSKNQKKASEVFGKLLSRHPSDITLEWIESYVSILFATGEKKKAIKYLETLAQKTSGKRQRQWQEMLLYQYLEHKMEKRSLAYAKTLTRDNPVEPMWWRTLLHIYLDRNDYKQALNALIIYGFLAPLTNEEQDLMENLYLSLGIPFDSRG
ncbi:tetratricopeptide repeat protein [Desulfamplus magnetovallimortis]|nr:tetratricopeptide repeat protein [Desulfamplus magnetovallimortis]